MEVSVPFWFADRGWWAETSVPGWKTSLVCCWLKIGDGMSPCMDGGLSLSMGLLQWIPFSFVLRWMGRGLWLVVCRKDDGNKFSS